MKLPAKGAAWMLPLLLTGCIHRNQQAQIQPLAPPLVEAPPPAPPPQITTAPQPPAVAETTPQPSPAPPPKEEPKHRARRRKPVAKDNVPTTEVADNTVPAIGQLSSGDPPNLRLQTQNSIDNTARQLAEIKGNLSEQDKRTIEHILEFLNQAKKALASGDVDGANTLAEKAHVLLAEVIH